jgi:hypothetical protein
MNDVHPSIVGGKVFRGAAATGRFERSPSPPRYRRLHHLPVRPALRLAGLNADPRLAEDRPENVSRSWTWA